MAFNFLSLPQAERAEEPAPIDGEERRGYGSFKTSKTSKKSIAADFLPMLSTAGLESDSDDGTPLALEGQFDVLAMACEPPPEAFPGLPTHVILRVLKVTGLPTKLESKGIPGHEGLGFFLHDKGPLERSTASVAVLPQDQTRPGRHRCAEPRVTPKTAGETWEAAWNRDVPGEVKVQLKEGQDTVCAGVLLGQEVVAVTGPIDLTGTLRRFFQNQVLYRPGFSGVAVGMMQDASVYIALELFPAGSQFPPRPSPVKRRWNEASERCRRSKLSTVASAMDTAGGVVKVVVAMAFWCAEHAMVCLPFPVLFVVDVAWFTTTWRASEVLRAALMEKCSALFEDADVRTVGELL